MTSGKYWDEAWSLVEGCTEVSPACRHCWSAAQTAMRARQSNPKIVARYGGLTDAAGRFNGTIRLMEGDLQKPVLRRKPTIYAIWNDLFHEDVPDHFIHEAWRTMMCADWHVFLVLTKRAARMRAFVSGLVEKLYRTQGEDAVLPNVFLGVTAENQAAADARIPDLLATPAAVRYVSYEPALGPITLPPECFSHFVPNSEFPRNSPLIQRVSRVPGYSEMPARLSWVIAGGETGRGARPSHPDWFRGVRDACAAAGVPFWFKGWGEYAPSESLDAETCWRYGGRYRRGDCDPDLIRYAPKGGDFVPAGDGCTEHGYVSMFRVGHANAGRLLDGVKHNGVPAVLEAFRREEGILATEDTEGHRG